jgi:hypothetical protein
LRIVDPSFFFQIDVAVKRLCVGPTADDGSGIIVVVVAEAPVQVPGLFWWLDES